MNITRDEKKIKAIELMKKLDFMNEDNTLTKKGELLKHLNGYVPRNDFYAAVHQIPEHLQAIMPCKRPPVIPHFAKRIRIY